MSESQSKVTTVDVQTIIDDKPGLLVSEYSEMSGWPQPEIENYLASEEGQKRVCLGMVAMLAGTKTFPAWAVDYSGNFMTEIPIRKAPKAAKALVTLPDPPKSGVPQYDEAVRDSHEYDRALLARVPQTKHSIASVNLKMSGKIRESEFVKHQGEMVDSSNRTSDALETAVMAQRSEIGSLKMVIQMKDQEIETLKTELSKRHL
jgi:hypothetical protein